MGRNSTAIISDDYAGLMVQFVGDVYELKDMGADGARCAFNVLLQIGLHAHGDLEASMMMSGYGGHEGPFAKMDFAMLSIIALREDADCKGKDEGLDLPVVRHRWSRADADVGVFKTGDRTSNREVKLNGRRRYGSRKETQRPERKDRRLTVGSRTQLTN